MKRAFNFLGVHCLVEADDPVVVAWLDDLFWRFAADPTSDCTFSFSVETNGDQLSLFVEDSRTHTGLQREEATMRLLVELNRVTVSGLKGFGVHAGAVLGPKGAVLLPGGPGTGKSTLTAACGLMGMDYLTDEIVLFTEDCRVRPFPKPLWLSSWSRCVLQLGDDTPQFVAPGFKAPVAPDNIDVGVVAEDTTLSHIVLIARSDGESTIERASASDGAAALMSNSYHLDERSQQAFSLSARAAREASVIQLGLGEPLESARVLLATVS